MPASVKESLTVSERISRRGEISSILKRGRRRRVAQFEVIFRESQQPFDRVAVLVSRSTGSAVERNQIKRAVREIFRRHKSSVPPYFDILVRPVAFTKFSRLEALACFVEWRTSLVQ